jgi:hypothetical protein
MNVNLTAARQRMIRLVAAKYGLSSAEYVQAVISAALITEAQNDETLRLMLLKAAGMSWSELTSRA